MTATNEFTGKELKLIAAVKDTLKIMAKVIKDREPGEVIKDLDPRAVVESDKYPYIADIMIKFKFLERLKEHNSFSENENNILEILIDHLATAIKEEYPSEDIDEGELGKIIKSLTSAIRGKITPDIPGLNPKDEGVIVGQLGPSVFAYLIRKGDRMHEFDNMFSIPVEPMPALAPGQSRDLGVKEGMKVIVTDIYIENYGEGLSYLEILEKTGENGFETRYRFRAQSDQPTTINFNTGLRLGEETSLDSIRIQNSRDSQVNIIARVNGFFMP